MKNKKIKIIFLMAIAIFLGLGFCQNIKAANCNDIATGNWGSSATWDCAIVPDSSDNVTIDSHTVTLAAAQSVNNITISGGILDLSASNYTLTVYGNWAKTSGTFTERSGTIDFALASGTQTLNSGGTDETSNFCHLSHSGAGTVQLITNAILINGTFTNSAGTFDANNLNIIIRYGGNWTLSGGIFVPGTGTVEFTKTSIAISYITGATTFYNLLFSGTARQWQICDDLVVQNNFTITNTDDMTNSIIPEVSETHNITVLGNVIHSGTACMTAGLTIVMNGSTAQTVTTSNTGYIGSLQISNTQATVSLGSNLLVRGLLTIDASTTLDVTGSNYNITISAIFGGGWTRNGTFIQRQGTVDFKKAAIGDPRMAITGITTFYNLSFSATGRNYQISDNLVVQNNLIITNTEGSTGIYNEGAETPTISVGGNVTHSGTIHVDDDIKIVMNGSTAQAVTTSDTGKLGDLQISNTQAEVQLGSVLQLLGDIIVDANTTFDIASYGINGAAATSFTNNGVLQLEGDQTITVTTMTNNTGSTVEYTATSGTRAIKNWIYTNATLKINGAGGTFTLPANLTCVNLIITAGTLAASGYTITVSSTFDNQTNGILQLLGTETLTFTKDTDSGTVEYTGTNTTLNYGYNYYSVKFNNASTTWTLGAALDVNGNLNLAAGTLATAGYAITVAGNWMNSGTFTAGTGTVVFDGSGTSIIYGDTIFNDFTCITQDKTLSFDVNSVQTVSGTWTITGGADGHNIILSRNNGSGNDRWFINPTYWSVNYVTVSNSYNQAINPINPTHYSDFGNNFNWFPAAPGPGMASASYKIISSDINAGGTENQISTTSGYKMADTLGGIATGISESEHYKLKAGYRQMQEVYISVSAPETVVMVPALLAITGGTAEETADINVKTDNPTGYKLELKAFTSRALKLITGEFFEDYPRKTPPDFIWDIGSANSIFGFTLWGGDTVQRYRYTGTICNQFEGTADEDYCWDGFDGSENIEIASSSSANHPSGTYTSVKYRAEIKTDQGFQTPGDYTAVITATATAK